MSVVDKTHVRRPMRRGRRVTGARAVALEETALRALCLRRRALRYEKVGKNKNGQIPPRKVLPLFGTLLPQSGKAFPPDPLKRNTTPVELGTPVAL